MKLTGMNYPSLIKAISKVHAQSQSGAAGAVNRLLVMRNWLIGFYLVEFEQIGKDRAKYGAGLLARVSMDLSGRGINGLGVSMLKNCRQFYTMYPQFRQSVTGEFKELGRHSKIRQSVIGESGAPVTKSLTTDGSVPKPFIVESLFGMPMPDR